MYDVSVSVHCVCACVGGVMNTFHCVQNVPLGGRKRELYREDIERVSK